MDWFLILAAGLLYLTIAIWFAVMHIKTDAQMDFIEWLCRSFFWPVGPLFNLIFKSNLQHDTQSR